MLENLVAWVFNNYLGKYVQNLNTDQLSIALLSGAVELENLPLKREALRHIGIPVEIKAGFIGKVRLQVPVTQIRTASWVIAIERLYLVAGPINLEEYDSEAEEHAMVDYKLSRLEALEARWRAESEQGPGYYATSYSTWVTYGTSLVTNIIENLQLNIKDVHIRYEDTATLPNGAGIAFGITINGLTAQSCDASWVPGSTSWNLTDASFKLMELNGLSVYWDQMTKEQMFHDLDLGKLDIAMNEYKKQNKCYILSPVSAEAHIKRDRSEKPLRSPNKPRIVVDLSLDQVPLSLSDVQYEQIIGCIKGLDEIDRQRRQRRCRPLTSVHETPKEWWRYAARCYIGRRTLIPKKTWEDVLQLGRNNVIYVDACVKLLSNPTISLPPDIKKLKEKMESDLSFDELRVLRELAMMKVRPPKPAQTSNLITSPQAQGMLVQWFPQWWGWQSAKAEQTSNTSPTTASSTFDGELLDVLADTIDDDTLIRRDTVFGLFNFALSKGAISLCTVTKNEPGKSFESKTVMELQFERVHVSYESRPRSGSHKFSISLGALFLHDHLTENSSFPILIQPQTLGAMGSSSRLRSSSDKLGSHLSQSLFELVYEKRPLHVGVDHLLHVNSRSLDVVYNPVAIRWLLDFMYEPHRTDGSNSHRLQAMKRRTRRQLMKNWEQILEGDSTVRSSWDLQLNISAPQILLVDNFVDANAIVLVVDFGRLHLTNNSDSNQTIVSARNLMSPTSEVEANEDEDDEDERFETPCSTPPGSEENGSVPDLHQGLSESALHKKLYDHYTVDLSDLQVLVGKVKDNWKHARTRGMSSLHVLERFNISLQIERRVVTTTDPHFPSVTVSGNLPRLVVHVNEQKVESMRSMYHLLYSLSNNSPVSVKPNGVYTPEEPESPKKEENLDKTLNHAMMIQFIIDQMTFELQSRGRSVAELQVSGVRATLSKRPADLSASLSVHGLLLVDALQEFGPDFELLVASHKHVGMDSISGSLRDSEPTSPTSPVSPGSPDPNVPRRLTSPVALTNALSTLAHHDARSPLFPKNLSSVALEQLDSEALIVVEVMIVDEPLESLKVANIQFNNLDVIANQETIVELMGFARRLFPPKKRKVRRMERYESLTSLNAEGRATRTEITFDFHRLNVLLLRAVMQDSHLVGQKIATATMTDARIQATLASDNSISGSLGGLQILDQTLIGKIHQRIISVGRDPIADPDSSRHHSIGQLVSPTSSDQNEAFRFKVSRSTRLSNGIDGSATLLDISVRIGSVWYTHAPHLISELRSCADEFKQYLSNWARQIGAAATDMAIGLVNAEDWTIPQRKRLPSFSLDGTDTTNILLKLDLVLNSPVLVIPRSSQSAQVFVAHLGTMSLQHEPPSADSTKQKINLEVKDMNLHSLDVSMKINQVNQGNILLRAEEMYSCKENGKPILHDTLLKVTLERDIGSRCQSPGFPIEIENTRGTVDVHGVVVTPLKVSLSRTQYEQLLDTVHRLISVPISTSEPIIPKQQEIVKASSSSDIQSNEDKYSYTDRFDLPIKIFFELPALSIELKQEGRLEQPLVELSMRDLSAKYEKLQRNESTTQVALRSLLMEDLLCPVGSRHRFMMQSSAPTRARLFAGVSRSCPDLVYNHLHRGTATIHGSLPDRLETDTLYGAVPSHWRRKVGSVVETPHTPPPSPGVVSAEENLVLISISMKEPDRHSHQQVRHKHVSVDFNCLDLIVSVESWMVVLDFLGIGSPSNDATSSAKIPPSHAVDEVDSEENSDLPVHSEMEIEINSLTMVLRQPEREIARANISNASMHIVKADGINKVSGSLGSMSLLDLTPHGRCYRERFLSSGRKAFNFQYLSYADSEQRDFDAQLKLQMSAVHYVHTQRFVAELQAFFAHFSQLRTVMANLRAGGSAIIDVNKRSIRLSLELHAGAPVILLPVSSRSEEMLLLNLGELSAHNRFEYSTLKTECLLDVMDLELLNMDVYAAKRINANSGDKNNYEDSLSIGGFTIEKMGCSLLTEKCHLKLKIERNLDTYLSRDIPDLSVHGTLSTMICALDTSQYMLIRGLLSYNIGENMDDLRAFMESTNMEYSMTSNDLEGKAWTSKYISLELVNVTLKLHPNHSSAALACVNFIKSKLILESLSDGSQDVDLVSREILVTDTRFHDEPVNRRSNVFTSILQPLSNSSGLEDRVQAEVHHRKRNNFSSTTILLHSMRLTAILDWWEAVRDFLVLNSPEPEPVFTNIVQVPASQENETNNTKNSTQLFEFKCNVMDSELVLVEDTSMWDTNAVILKSTAVLAYRSDPKNTEKPLSCNLSHCELFSCILGLEEETALSIIDPVAANFELTQDKCLEVHLQPLNVRLSYHDVNMFLRMLSSLPKQTLLAKQKQSMDGRPPANAKNHVVKLSALGFAEIDCETALDKCNGHLDDAALWLTQNAVPNVEKITHNDGFPFTVVVVETSCLKICIIDDCRDADVPLLELTLLDLCLRQEYCGVGEVSATFSVDYYNRMLSGWEPFVEQWRASMQWEQTFSLSPKRFRIRVDSHDSVNVNITSTLVELVTLVKENWTQDYYLLGDSNSGNNKNYRRRSPFVPFALKNETGSKIWFKTLIATAQDDIIFDRELLRKNALQRDETWSEVPVGETVSFTFENRGKLRHRSTHVARRHQVAVVVEGWKVVDPVTVDRVGIYFRHANLDFKGSEMVSTKARIVFNVELEGSARKLVTVRSALQVMNKLSYNVDLKLEKSISYYGYSPTYTSTLGGRTLQIPAQSRISIPLTHTDVQMFMKPVHPNGSYHYCMEAIDWTSVKKLSEIVEIQATCRTNQQNLFRMCISIKRDNYPLDTTQTLPAHTISIIAPMTLTNLLPHELHFSTGGESGRIAPGDSADLHSLNNNEHLEISIQLDGYPGVGTLILPQNSNSFTGRIRLSDSIGRIMFIHGTVIVEKGFGTRINITAPYWIINKTALPLVFKQEGSSTEFAGQFEEHEKARMLAPLLFSFNDEEMNGTLSVRVGNGVHSSGIPQWCQHFHLQPGVQVHRLRVALRDGKPDIVYLIGIAVRAAKGRYNATTVVTLSPRYQLHNKSSFTLELAQKCLTTTVTHPEHQATYLKSTPNCHMPFHWPRLDKDQLLCVRIDNVPNCMWSGGIMLHGNHSLTINVRDVSGLMYFLRVDVVLQESTYFIVFSDADTVPPPIRVDNFSEVPLTINQTSVLESLQWTVRPHCSVPYALDEPTLPAALVVTAPGGVTASYDLNVLGECRGLTYENFIYIAFAGTFKSDGDLGNGESGLDPLDVETQRLVLEAGPGGWVALRRKQYGARSQLWRMTGDGQLQHEGSSPPRDKHSRTPDTVLVLDIAGTAPQPFTYCPLALRRPDPRRRSTQTWRFTDDGRLCCVHANMCVQSKDGFMGLQEGGRVARWQMWSEAVLGPQTNCSPPPIEQRVGRQRLRPGSGYLSVRVTTDGPTRVLQILDIKERKNTFALLEERDWSNISVAQRPTQVQAEIQNIDARELHLSVDLPAGLGLSIVSRRPAEELIFCRFAGINLDFVDTPVSKSLDLSIQDVQIDNQLFEAQCTSVLYISRNLRGEGDSRPAIHVAAEKLPSKNENAEIYKHLIVSVKPVCVHLEERLILKLTAFVGAGFLEQEAPVDENDFNHQRFISNVSAAHAKRYYFAILKLVPSQVELSVLTTTKLPPHLHAIKKKLGLTLIKFEDATIELEPFIRKHPFESSQFLIHSIIKHYKDELKWQAAIILGSVDFLGSPLGFVNDVSEGVSGLINELSVKTLVKNVAHGFSSSAAKLTESLSDGFGRVIMDEKHEETRQKIRANTTGSKDHLVAGVKGLGLGLLGGMTSIVLQTYDGTMNEGFPGFFAGLGKGVVGTITKPAVGILDFATESATAIRETSRSAHRIIPKRDRQPRVSSGPAGLLPPYNHQQTEGQELLHSINNRNFSELFVAYECLRSGTDNLKVLVSNERVTIISGSSKSIVLEVSLADLIHCQPTYRLESNGQTLHYIELTSRAEPIGSVHTDGAESLRRPKVRCDSEDIAKWVSRQINYAKGMHEERRLTLMSSDNMLDDIQIYK